MNFKSQNFSITFFPSPSIFNASFDTKCLSFSLAILLQSKPISGHLLTASIFFVTLLNSLIVSKPQGHFFGK